MTESDPRPAQRLAVRHPDWTQAHCPVCGQASIVTKAFGPTHPACAAPPVWNEPKGRAS
jgi:hypothetical protein